MRRLNPARALRRAFTLVELLIAIAIATFVVAALYNLFTVQLKQFVYQDLQMEMHQNIRLAMDVLTRTARNAGMGTNGEVAGALGLSGSPDATLPVIISYDGAGPFGSDAVTFVSMDPDLVMYSDADYLVDCSGSEIYFDISTPGYVAKLGELQADEYLLCYDGTSPVDRGTYLWQIDGVELTTGQVDLDSSVATLNDFAAICPSGENMPVAVQCSRAEIITFYIDADDSDGIGAGSTEHPVLMMDLDYESPDDDDVPVVDHVEDLQIEYCFASDEPCGGGSWNNSLDTNSDGDSSNDPDDVYMIRVTVVVRSSREDLNDAYAGAPLSVANNTGSGDSDHYYRQVLSSEVAVRNMRTLQWQ